MEVDTSRKGEKYDKEKPMQNINKNRKKKKLSKIFIKYFKNIDQMTFFIRFWKNFNKEIINNKMDISNYNSNYSTNYDTNYSTNDNYGTNKDSEIILDQPDESKNMPEKTEIKRFVLSKPSGNEKDTEDNKDFDKVYTNIVNFINKGDEVQRKNSKKQLLDLLNSIDESDDKKKYKNIRIIEIKPHITKLLRKVFDGNYVKRHYFLRWKKEIKGEEIITTRKHTKSIKRVIIRKKKKKGDNEPEETQEVQEITKLGDINDLKSDDKDKGNTMGKEMGEIYNDFVTILNKGDKVQRKESKKRLLDIINSIDETQKEDIKEDTNKEPDNKIIEQNRGDDIEKVKKEGGKRIIRRQIVIKGSTIKKLKDVFEKRNDIRLYFNKWKEKSQEVQGRKRIKSIKRVVIKKKRKESSTEDTQPENIIKLMDAGSQDIKDNEDDKDKPKEEIIKSDTKVKEKNEEEIYNNIYNMLKKGDKAQRKESKKKLLDIINNIDDKKSMKYKLMTTIKVRAYRLIKEAFEKNNIKRKYFLNWKTNLGIQPKKHRKSIKRIIFKKKNKPETENKENKEDKKEQNLEDEKDKPKEEIKEKEDNLDFNKEPSKEITDTEDENKTSDNY